MAEYRLDIVGSAEGLTKGLQDAQTGLQELGEQAVVTGKETQKAFSDNGGVEKFGKSLKDQFLFLGKTEIEVRKLQKALKTAFDPKEVESLNKQLKATTDSTLKFNSELEKTTTVNKSLKAQLRENKAVLAEMEEQGLETTQSFFQLQVQTGKLQDQINDTNERIKFFASDTKGLDGLIGVTKLATAGFAVGEGAAALFGAENENVQKALLKVNAAMAILNGLQEIQQALQKSSAARITIETALTKIKIFFIGAETAATQGLTVSQLAAANAAKILRIALISLGIGAIIVGVVALANAMGAFGDSVDETNEKLKEQEDRLDKLANKFKEADDADIERYRNEAEIAKARAKLRNASEAELLKIDSDFYVKKKARLELQVDDATGSDEQRLQAKRNLASLEQEIELNNIAILQSAKDASDKKDENRNKKRIELTDKKAKQAKIDSEKLLKEIAEQNKAAEDFLTAEMKNQDDTDNIILKNKLDYIDNLEKIKLLELDIEFETGNKSITEARRIAALKLQIEIDAAEERIKLLKENNLTGTNNGQIKALELAVAQGKSAMKELAKDGDNSDFLKAIGLGDVTAEQLQSIKSNLKTVVDSIKSIFSTLLDTAIENNRNIINELDDQISKVESNIERQEALQNEGRANNLKQERENLDRLESQKREAFEKEKKLQRQKLNLEAIAQISSLITAAANIFQATSEAGPVGVALAVAAVAAMFAAFAVSQATARQSINRQTLGHGGFVGGKSHGSDGWGGNRYVSDNGDETYIEKDEYVVRKKYAKKYGHVLDAINTDNLQPMLERMGISLSGDRIEQHKALKQEFANSEIKYRVDLENSTGNKTTAEFKKSFEEYVRQQKTQSSITFSEGYKIEKRGNRTIRTKLK